MKRFVVVLRASGAIRVRDEEELLIDLPTTLGLATATFRTRYSDEGHASPIPRELWIDVQGEADCALDEAINVYWNAANQVLPSLAVACNAPVSDAEVHLAISVSHEGTEHEFFENFQPDEFGRPRHGRSLVFPATTVFLDALVGSNHRDRLLRACAFYREALNYLKPGQEAMHVAFLWMAVEALTKVALRRACEDEGCSDDQLVVRWGLADETADTEALTNAKRGLDGEARRRMIFHGDAACQHAAVKASDGFEHGFEDFGKVRSLAQQATSSGISAHVRAAIFELLQLAQPTLQRLTGGAFKKPRANWPITKYIRGTFVGPAQLLPAAGQEYPFLRWEGKVQEFERLADGQYRVTFTENLKVQAGEGVVFRPTRFDVWGPENDPVSATTATISDAEATYDPATSDSHVSEADPPDGD